MRKFRNLFLLALVALATFSVAACKDKTSKDTEAPEIVITKDNILIGLDATHDLTSFVTVTDNVSTTENITVEVSDWANFDISKEGTYTVTIKATDEAGNESTVDLTVKVQLDILPPMLTGSVLDISHLAGEEVDLTKGLTGIDNVDGENVTFTVTNLNGYEKDTAGTYKVQITISDSSGNQGNTFERTITVTESYARAEMESFEGEIIRFEALYNPQVLNGNTGTGFNTSYDGDYVNVLSKEYFEWLVEYAPDRIGSGIGWSVIAVTDENDQIVYVRHWNSGEAYMENGELVSIMATDWSTGTTRSWSETVNGVPVAKSNARYSSGEMGLMMANLNSRIPENGHVFIFMNWTTVVENDGTLSLKSNAPDMPRSMGGNYIMNSDEDGDDIKDYALGRTLKILDIEKSNQSERASFDSENPFPVITIPGEKYINSTGIWKNRYNKTLYLDKYVTNAYNPLNDITANDGKGNDITGDVTYKVYKFKTNLEVYGLAPALPITDPLWAELVDNNFVLSENEVNLQDIMVRSNDGNYYVVEYTVTANGHTDKAYRIIQIEKDSPDYLELYGPTDTVYSRVMGIDTRLEMNPDLVEFGAYNATDRGMLFTPEYYANMTVKPVLTKGVAVVLNEYYEVQTVRFLNGTPFELDALGTLKTDSLTWSASDLLAGISIPSNGYLLVYPEGLDNAVINDAFRAYYDYDFDGTVITTPVVVNGIVEVDLPIKEVQELSTLILNGVTSSITFNGVDYNVEVIMNSKSSLVHDPTLGGARFRSGHAKVYYFDKDMYQAYLTDSEVVDSFTNIANNLGVPWFNNGVVMIFDENGNFVKARLGVGAAAEVNADGTFSFGAAITNWDVTVYTADNEKVHGLLANIADDVPENGHFIIFPTTASTPGVRNLAIEHIWNAAYPGGGAIVDALLDPTPANVETLGFDSTTFTAEYFTSFSVVADYVATIVEQDAKLAKPEKEVVENELVWDADTNASQYDLYVNGLLFKENVGVLATDGLTYSVDLSTLMLPEGSLDLQLRAIAAADSGKATSVLSNAITFVVERLEDPTNFVRNDNVLSWDAVTDATSYFVSINDAEFIEVTTNEVVIPDADIVNGVVVKVYATGSSTKFDSAIVEHTLVVEVIPREIVMGSYTIPVKEFIPSSWMRYIGAGDIGAQWIEGFAVINNAEGFLTLEDSQAIFAGGYVVVLDSNNVPKYIVDRWGHEWNATDGWTTNAGGWTYGATTYASYVKPYIAPGDKLVLASQFATGLTEGTYRNIFGNALIKELGTVTTDHRYVDLTTALDPTTVAIEVRDVVTTKTISLGLNDFQLFTFDLASWLHFIDPLGSNDIGAAAVEGIVMIEGANGISDLEDTAKIFAGGYAAILDADMNVKYIVDRWGHEWNATDGWTTNAGAWTYGATLYASYFKPHLAEGDVIILASQYNKGLPTGTYRNYFGNALIKDLGSYTTDHRSVDLATAINPTTVTITVKEAVSTLRIGNGLFNYKSVTFDNWMTYAQNDVGAANIHELVLVSEVENIVNYLDNDKVFAGGYVILLDSNMNVKYIVDRWSNEWTAATGWVEVDTNWAYGTNAYVSYFKDLVEAGDMLILGGQYENGLTPGASYRDVLGNIVFFDLGASIYSGDHRSVVVGDAIDPTTVIFEIKLLD